MAMDSCTVRRRSIGTGETPKVPTRFQAGILRLKDCLCESSLDLMSLIGKLFGRSKSEPVEVKASISFAPEVHFRRAAKRILAKYRATIRKLDP
jgi:hypothetical protein